MHQTILKFDFINEIIARLIKKNDIKNLDLSLSTMDEFY